MAVLRIGFTTFEAVLISYGVLFCFYARLQKASQMARQQATGILPQTFAAAISPQLNPQLQLQKTLQTMQQNVQQTLQSAAQQTLQTAAQQTLQNMQQQQAAQLQQAAQIQQVAQLQAQQQAAVAAAAGVAQPVMAGPGVQRVSVANTTCLLMHELCTVGSYWSGS